MKAFVQLLKMSVLASVVFSSATFAAEEFPELIGVRSRTNHAPVYVVHGGCRQFNLDPSKTEIWLYLSAVPHQRYDQRQMRASAYISSSAGSWSNDVCTYLREAVASQKPVHMSFILSSRNELVVRSILNRDIPVLLHGTDARLLENFSVPETRSATQKENQK